MRRRAKALGNLDQERVVRTPEQMAEEAAVLRRNMAQGSFAG